MTIVERIKASLIKLGGVASLKDIYITHNNEGLRIIKEDIYHLKNKPAKKFLDWRYKNYKK